MIAVNRYKFLIPYIALICSIHAYSKSNNTRRNYIDIVSKYYMGNTLTAQKLEILFFYVENIYDAMILSYSALANHNLAFADRAIELRDNSIYMSN